MIDAVAEHAAHPKTFQIPHMDECMSLVAGDYVKIGVRNDGLPSPNGERFWVKITTVSSRPKATYRFVGVIDNDLTVLFLGLGMDAGDKIKFNANHIMCTHDHNQNYEKYERTVAA